MTWQSGVKHTLQMGVNTVHRERDCSMTCTMVHSQDVYTSHVHVRTHARMNTHTCTHTHTHTRAHTHTHTRTHTHTHAHTHTHSECSGPFPPTAQCAQSRAPPVDIRLPWYPIARSKVNMQATRANKNWTIVTISQPPYVAEPP